MNMLTANDGATSTSISIFNQFLNFFLLIFYANAECGHWTSEVHVLHLRIRIAHGLETRRVLCTLDLMKLQAWRRSSEKNRKLVEAEPGNVQMAPFRPFCWHQVSLNIFTAGNINMSQPAENNANRVTAKAQRVRLLRVKPNRTT